MFKSKMSSILLLMYQITFFFRAPNAVGNRTQLRKRLSREVSVVSSSSTASFQSCNSDDGSEPDIDSNNPEKEPLVATRASKTLEMEALGQRLFFDF